MVTLTVFTPVYNRAHTLPRTYESLCIQDCKDFMWLIIDDGSTDGVESLIREWQKKDNGFEIQYIYKENGGMHTAHNVAYEHIVTELNTCIDSDDWMPADAIEKIEKTWNRIKDKGYVGIMGIDCYENGDCVGGAFPKNVTEMYLYEKLTKYEIPGDKKMIHRTDLLKKVAPMPTFDGEKNFNPSYMMYQLDQFGKLYVTNDCFCIVDYQPDGMSSNIYKQYRNSPNSFAETRKLYLQFPNTSAIFKLRHSIHYISSCILAKNFVNGILKSPYPGYAVLALIPSLMLTVLVMLKTRDM